MKRIFREPIIIFLLIGGIIYWLSSWITQSKLPEEKRIVISSSQIKQLSVQFSRTWMRPPTETELDNLVQNHIRDEVYYREALTLGMDRDDQVIRRRLRQKLELLMSNMASANVPSDQMLRTFMQENAEKFRMEPQVSFLQIYLNPDKRQNISSDAKEILARLQAGASFEEVGDPTLWGYEFEKITPTEITRLFGADFADQVIELTPGNWAGPLYSGVGGHLIKVTEHIEDRMPELSEIRDIVEREWMAKRSKELKDAAYNKLLEGYEVIIEEDGIEK